MEEILNKEIEIADRLIDRLDKASEAARHENEKWINLQFKSRKSALIDFKNMLEKELFAQKILKLCRTGR